MTIKSMTDISLNAYQIEAINNDGFKTVLTVKGLSNGKSMKITFNNSEPFPFDPDANVALNVLFKIKKEDYDSFRAGGSLLSSKREKWTINASEKDKLLCICTEKVFPINKDDILIIEEPSIYAMINNVFSCDKN